MLIKEDFLHYLWKFKLLVVNKLQTTDGLDIMILNPGEHNHNSGPDFFNANLVIGNQNWAGNIEIHKSSSDWYVHHHEKDTAYDNVILHVVWKHDADIYRNSGELIPTLELRHYIESHLLKNYRNLFMKPVNFISCENEIGNIDRFTFDNWLERLYVERLCKRSEHISYLLKRSKNNWEAVFFRLLAGNFGLKVNADAFLAMSQSFDFSIFRAQQYDLTRMEALLFGQAGFLNNSSGDVYYQKLRTEYIFLRSKYHLNPVENKQFHFFRLRPVNFPTLRIAQLSNLYFIHKHLFSRILEVRSVKDFYDLLSVETSPFWKEHYSFVSPSKKMNKKINRSFIDLLLINTIFPMIFQYHKKQGNLEKAQILQFIQELRSEKNHVIDKFEAIGIRAENALHTQALLQLKHEYCDKHLCLQCVVGNKLLRHGNKTINVTKNL